MRLIPDGEMIRLIDLAPGTLFSIGNDCIALKSEYFLDSGKVEAIIVGSGEFFHAAPTAEEQYNLMVQPLTIEDNEPKAYATSSLMRMTKSQLIEYISHLKRHINRYESLVKRQVVEYKSLMKEKCAKCMRERD